MDWLELLIAALYGLVEGITEWLPVSSTGHMMLLNSIVPLRVSPEFWNMFLVVIQLGAILAVCILYFHELNPFSPTKAPDEKRDTWTLWAKIVVACIPAAVVGIPLDDWMEEHLSSPLVIAAALIVYGIVFIVLENSKTRTQVAPGARHLSYFRDENAFDITWGQALGMGFAQILSLVPGTSRSGSTIIGGLAMGTSRPVAAEFTFFLAIPVMFGASALRLVKYFLEGGSFVASEFILLGVGALVAFVVSIAAIRFLVGFVRRHDFKPFGWYRIILGIVCIVWYFLVRA